MNVSNAKQNKTKFNKQNLGKNGIFLSVVTFLLKLIPYILHVTCITS